MKENLGLAYRLQEKEGLQSKRMTASLLIKFGLQRENLAGRLLVKHSHPDCQPAQKSWPTARESG
eukprot:116460-Pelagomonas_calceolata.AAC.1